MAWYTSSNHFPHEAFTGEVTPWDEYVRREFEGPVLDVHLLLNPQDEGFGEPELEELGGEA